MLFPALGTPESEVGGSRLEVEIDEFDEIAVGETGGEILGAVLGFEKGFFNTATKDDAAEVVLVIAIVTSLSVKGIGELLDEIGVGHLLDKNNIGFPLGKSRDERSLMAGPIAGDDSQGLPIEVGLGRSGLGCEDCPRRTRAGASSERTRMVTNQMVEVKRARGERKRK